MIGELLCSFKDLQELVNYSLLPFLHILSSLKVIVTSEIFIFIDHC